MEEFPLQRCDGCREYYCGCDEGGTRQVLCAYCKKFCCGATMCKVEISNANAMEVKSWKQRRPPYDPALKKIIEDSSRGDIAVCDFCIYKAGHYRAYKAEYEEEEEEEKKRARETEAKT